MWWPSAALAVLHPWVLLCPRMGLRHLTLFKLPAAYGQRWLRQWCFQGVSCQPGPALKFPL